ncbi:MAG: tetratricopeptide repeat protein [Myxococcota bacterium]
MLFAAVVALYAPAARLHFIYDDHALVVGPAPGSAGELGRRLVEQFVRRDPHWDLPYYRPLPRSTYLAQQFAHGNDPRLFHLFNVLLTATAALLAYALLRTPAFGVSPGPAWLAGALFAFHPVASSCAYPISARETLMPAIFVMASLAAFLRAGGRWYALAVALFAAALLCKEQAAIVPGLFALADALGLSADAPGRSPRRWLLRYAPPVAVLAAYAAVRAALIGGEEHQLALLEHPSGPLLALLFSLQALFAPHRELLYEPRVEVWLSPWRLLLAAAACTALAVAARRRWPRVRAATLFWLGWFLLALAPTANLLVQEARFAERYAFLAWLGPLGVAAALASDAWDRPAVRRGIVAAGALLLTAYGAISFQRSQYFASDRAFLAQWLRSDPRSAQAHYSYGQVLVREQRFEEAIGHFRRALAVNPSFLAHNKLGLALASLDRHAEAVRHQRRALRLRPDSAQAHLQLAESLRATGELDEALLHYRRAIEGEPTLALAHYRLGLALADSGRREEAEPHLREAVRLEPALGRNLERRGLRPAGRDPRPH